MNLNLDQAAEAAARLSYLANVKLDEDLKNISRILQGVDENKLTAEMYESLAGMETAYNEKYLEPLHAIEDVFKNQIPELADKINSITVDSLNVKSADVSVQKIDVDSVSVL